MVTEQQFSEWLEKLVKTYPQITGVALVGSRATGDCNEDADWTVVVRLNDSCYEPVTRMDVDGMLSVRQVTFYEQVDRIEQRITFDPYLDELDPDEDINLLFFRPDGHIGSWYWLELEALAEETITGSVDHLKRIMEGGIAQAKLAGAPGAVELAYTLFGMVPDRGEKKIQKQLKRANILYGPAYCFES